MDDRFPLDQSQNTNPDTNPCESDVQTDDGINMNTSTENVNETTTAFEEIAPVVNETTTAFEEIAPVVNETTPVFEEIVPVVNETTPVFEEIVPVVNETTPVFEEIVPVVNETTPVFEEIAPVVNETTPVFEEIAPVVNETAPAFEEIQPTPSVQAPVAPVAPVVQAPVTPVVPAGPRWSDFVTEQPTQAINPEAGMCLSERIVYRLRAHRFVPTILWNFEKRSHALLDSKFGGPYYNPAGQDVPRNPRTGQELFLLAQFNFAHMPKQKDFPETGLLQIFMDPDPHAFAAYKHPTQQIAWQIRYIPNTPSYSEIDPNGYKPDMTPFEGRLCSIPFDCRRFLMLRATDTQQFVYWDDFPFQSMLDRYCSDLIPANPTPIDMDAMRMHRNDAMIQLRNAFKPGKAQDIVIQMDGYPSFNGNPDIRPEDPRFPGIRTPNVLLLQLPSFHGFNWGGDRLVHFFISRKDLRERNFNNVMTDI